MSEPSTKLSANLSGKVALVTGASRGLGRAIAETLAANGATVACIASTESRLQEVVAAIREAGGTAEYWCCDVGNTDQINETVDQVLEKLGGIDIVVNNAGITRDTLLMRMSDQEWDDVMNVNLRSAFAFTRACARPMIRKRAGRIINITSVSGLTGNAGQANYAASKAGMVGLTLTAAKELATRGITVNAVAPGFIESDMTSSLPEKVMSTVLDHTLLGRVGQPQEIADAVLFLASDAAGFITGQVLTVDGGLTI